MPEVGVRISTGIASGGQSWSSYIKPLAAFYSDGTEVGGQLLDISGNARHATITDNLITDGGAELGSTLIAWNTATITNSTEQAHSGTKSHKVVVSGASTIQGFRSMPFRTLPGEVVNFSFWIYPTAYTGTVIRLQVLKGDGTPGWQNLSAQPTLNQWNNITGSFTDAVGGDKGEIRGYVQTGDLGCYLDDLLITITGKTGVGVIMADDATLKAIDTNNTFYAATTGIPNTIRTDIGDPTINNLKMFTGGSKKYIFLSDVPTASVRKILYEKYVDHDWLFDSCEVVKTVGAGKTYATIQAAIDSFTTGTITNRCRIDVYDNVTATEAAHYIKNYPNVGYYCVFATDKAYIYISGVGDITVEGTLPEDATDDQLVKLRLIDIPNGSIRNIKFKKTNGAYTMHHDYVSAAWTKFVNCEFHNYDMDNVIAYRIANALPLPNNATGGKTPVGMGMAAGEVIEFINCKMTGICALTNHGGHNAGAASHMILYNCDLTSMPYYNPTHNADSEILTAMELTTSPGAAVVKSNAQILKSRFNVAPEVSDMWTIETI